MILETLDRAIGSLTKELMDTKSGLSAPDQRRVHVLLDRIKAVWLHFNANPQATAKITPPTQINMNEGGNFPAGRES